MKLELGGAPQAQDSKDSESGGKPPAQDQAEHATDDKGERDRAKDTADPPKPKGYDSGSQPPAASPEKETKRKEQQQGQPQSAPTSSNVPEQPPQVRKPTGDREERRVVIPERSYLQADGFAGQNESYAPANR